MSQNGKGSEAPPAPPNPKNTHIEQADSGLEQTEAASRNHAASLDKRLATLQARCARLGFSCHIVDADRVLIARWASTREMDFDQAERFIGQLENSA